MSSSPVRGLYTSSFNGTLYTVIAQVFYSVSNNFVLTSLGSVPGSGPVSMSDNGVDLVVVNGDGYVYNAMGVRNALTELALAGATSLTTFAQSLVQSGDQVVVQLDDGTQQTVNATTNQSSGSFSFTPPLTTSAGVGNVIQDTSRPFAQITDTGWSQSDRVDFIDTYLIFSKRGSRQWYWSLSGLAVFDPLDFGTKSGSQDEISAVAALYDLVWVLGNQRSTEIWFDAGAADSAFARFAGVFIEHGCNSAFALAKSDLFLFWLGQDPQGHAVVFMGGNYKAQKVSTPAVDYALAQLPVSQLKNAIGFTFQFYGHTFYTLVFPHTSDDNGPTAGWLYDISTNQWSQWSTLDANGNLARPRANCHAFAYGMNIVGDYENGNLYELDPNTYTDNGTPIARIRGWPHVVQGNKRVSVTQFVADLEPGEDTGELDANASPEISLRTSLTKGLSWGNPVVQSLGALGAFATNVQWRRVAYGRDLVFEVNWSVPCKMALNGAWLEFEVAET